MRKLEQLEAQRMIVLNVLLHLSVQMFENIANYR